MEYFISGLVLFLGCHSVRVFAGDWRSRMLASIGEKLFKGIYSVLSLAGFVLLVYGFSKIRWDSPLLWSPPVAMRYVAALLMLLAMVLLVAGQIPHNAFKARLGHPMVLSVKVWALAHLLSNGKQADLILFGAFLLWSVLNFRAARQRDHHSAESGAALEATPNTLRVVMIGVAAWAILLFGGHSWLFELSPL
ncbi:MAG: protein NrnU [Limnohabitans sp.]|nr:protein NrnU [Limnohabitans sp.]